MGGRLSWPRLARNERIRTASCTARQHSKNPTLPGRLEAKVTIYRVLCVDVLVDVALGAALDLRVRPSFVSDRVVGPKAYGREGPVS
jgi:hypothetical protein